MSKEEAVVGGGRKMPKEEVVADGVFGDPDLAKTYVKFRPAPPPRLIETVVAWSMKGSSDGGDGGGVANLCVDIGCGSGQNTSLLAPHFATVVGVDVSEAPVAVAREMYRNVANLSFRVGSAEAMPFDDGTVDLITCCASVHWLNLDAFYREVDRVLRPGGVLACYSYMICSPVCNGQNLRPTMKELWYELKEYWMPGHYTLWPEYSTLPQLYEDDIHIGSDREGFSMECEEHSMDGVIGYLRSWSGLDKLRINKGREAAETFLEEAKRRLLEKAGTHNDQEPVIRQYKYFLRMWRKPLLQ